MKYVQGVLPPIGSPVPVEVLSTHHDLLDVLAALGGITGALAAVVALKLAAQSARDASVSLRIMEEEANEIKRVRAQRAKLMVELLARELDPSRKQLILTLVFRNRGSRVAEHVGINFAVPSGLIIRPCNQYGEIEEFGQVVATPRGISETGGTMWTCDEIGPVRLTADVVQPVLLEGAPVGRYDLAARVTYDDHGGDSLSLDWRLHVPGRPRKITVDPPATWAVRIDHVPGPASRDSPPRTARSD
jgi:hypothetical protein